MHNRPRLTHPGWLLLALIICAGMMAAPIAVSAQGEPPAEGTPIMPTKPEGKAILEIVSYHTTPQQLRLNEPFDLHLVIKNVGAITADGWTLANKNCTESGSAGIISEGSCFIPLPRFDSGQSAQVVLRLRPAKASEEATSLGLTLAFQDSELKELEIPSLSFHFLKARVIGDAQPTLERPFQGPDITVGRTWTAKARSTVEELLTPVPLRIDEIPVSTEIIGGPEFELVVELQNQGHTEATNIFVEFCSGEKSSFNPVGSTCRKFVPANLPPGAKAIASQTLAYSNSADKAARGMEVQLIITYQFWYANQWVQSKSTPKVYLYPQEYPAAVPPPQIPYLVVNTDVLNVRLGPSANYPFVGQVQRNQKFTIIGKNTTADWWQINFNGQPAWVAAYYVIAYGGETVAEVTSVPTLPPATPPPAPQPTRTPNPSPVALQQPPAASALVNIDEPLPGIGAEVRQPLPDDTRGLVLTGQRAALPQGAADLEALMAGPWVVIERYRSTPEQIVEGQPFTLELVLRNAGRATARRVALGWSSKEVVPLGAGNTRALDDLAPGSVSVVSGQFLLTDSERLNLLQVPVALLYSDENSQAHTRTEEIALLFAAPEASDAKQPAPATTTTAAASDAQQSGLPLWLRLLLGLLGLGAGPK